MQRQIKVRTLALRSETLKRMSPGRLGSVRGGIFSDLCDSDEATLCQTYTCVVSWCWCQVTADCVPV